MTNDIAKIHSGDPIKNGTMLVGTSWTGNYSTRDTYVKNTPTIETIQAKYDNRFYNGIFVQLVGNQTVVGG